jgi:hypothetical protein
MTTEETSYFEAGYMHALQFAREMLELNGNEAGADQIQAIIDTMATNTNETKE